MSERIAGRDVALEERLGVALARDEIGAEADPPARLVETVGDELIGRRDHIDAALAAAGRCADDGAAAGARVGSRMAFDGSSKYSRQSLVEKPTRAIQWLDRRLVALSSSPR